MRVPDLLRALAFFAALTLPAPVLADIKNRLRLSEAVSPERLRLRVHADALSAGALPPFGVSRMRRDMERQGYYVEEGMPSVVASDLVLAPIFSWDGNINGGVLRDSFVQNGLIFEAAPEVRAVSGVVAGVQGMSRTRIAFDTGKLIELRVGAELGYAPAVDIWRSDAQLGLCSQNHLTGWTFMNICATRSYYWRNLVEGNSNQISVEAVQVVATAASAHQFNLMVQQVSGNDERQNRIAFSADSVWTQVATRAQLTVGENQASTALHYRLDGGISWLMFDRTFSFDVSRHVLQGGGFLGVPRQDEVHGITISAELRPGAELRLGLIDSRSTAAIADYQQVSLDLHLDSFR